jgi:two-component system sensor histidine kinase CreC
MQLGLKLFLGYFLIVGIGIYFSLNILSNEIKPAFRQSAEETLIDSANLLAVLVRDDVLNGSIADGRLQSRLTEYARRVPNAQVWGIVKDTLDHRIYITDQGGIVLFDSLNLDRDRDFSRWNDVYLTLRGHYGARTTRVDRDDERTSVMYVAAPIRDGERIIGVLTVGMPSSSVQPYIDRAEIKLRRIGMLLVMVSLAVGLGFSWSLARSINRLASYARAAAQGERGVAPKSGGPELRALAAAVETMRTQLDGRDYVERYIQTLTHEMKSPLAAITGAAELLQSPLAVSQRQRFATLIAGEAQRLQQLIERLLALAAVEQQRELQERRLVPLQQTLTELLGSRQAIIMQKNLRIECPLPQSAAFLGEPFLIRQAIGNLLDNALDFTPVQGRITVTAEQYGTSWRLSIANTGNLIPEYALERLFERFYSLPRPDTGRKSTGLGLAFVKEVAHLHGGTISVTNQAVHSDTQETTIVARLSLPACL